MSDPEQLKSDQIHSATKTWGGAMIGVGHRLEEQSKKIRTGEPDRAAITYEDGQTGDLETWDTIGQQVHLAEIADKAGLIPDDSEPRDLAGAPGSTGRSTITFVDDYGNTNKKVVFQGGEAYVLGTKDEEVELTLEQQLKVSAVSTVHIGARGSFVFNTPDEDGEVKTITVDGKPVKVTVESLRDDPAGAADTEEKGSEQNIDPDQEELEKLKEMFADDRFKGTRVDAVLETMFDGWDDPGRQSQDPYLSPSAEDSDYFDNAHPFGVRGMRTPREAGLKIIADIERVNRAELDLDDLPDSMQELYHLCLGEDGTIDESRMMVEVAALLNCLDYIRDGYYEHPSYLLPRLEAVYGMVAAQRAKEGES